jgi:amino acid transporter
MRRAGGVPPTDDRARGRTAETSPDQQAFLAPTPAETIPRLGEQELEALRQLGRHWNAVAGARLERLRDLPVDPRLTRDAGSARPGRLTRVALFKLEGRDELEATAEATVPVSPLGRLLETVQRVVIGPPLRSSAIAHERMRKPVALAVLSGDLLASVAYGPEAMLAVLVLAGSRGLALSLPLAGVLVVLMLAVWLSYRQTIAAYPSGAGAYIVASDNLGALGGVTAGVGLLADYILNVAISVATGMAALTSAVPAVGSLTVPLGLAMIALLLAGNLRGVREAGYLFAAPTYLFLLAMFLLIGVGLYHAAGRGFAAVPPPPIKPVQGLTLLLILKAFSSGSTSMTGIEAVSNAVPAFHAPEWRNARTTLTWMVGLLVVIFVGLMLLIHIDGLATKPNETLLSQLAHLDFGGGAIYGFIQGATLLMLLFAADTSYNDFPRLLFYMARSGHAPRLFLRMGDRLAFSNGIVVLSVAAAAIYVAFQGKMLALIPLFAVGVFLAITLSQAGMVVHWWRRRGRHWRKSLAINGFGAVLTAVVVLVAAVTKFTSGAWVIVLGIPLLIWLCFRIRAHYDTVHEALAPRPLPDGAAAGSGGAAGNGGAPDDGGAAGHEARRTAATKVEERQESLEQIQHLLLVPVERLDLANLRALAYAASLEQPLLAVHLSPDEEEAEAFHREWDAWGVPLALEIVVSPYRALVPPLAHYIQVLHAQRLELTITVVIAELIVKRPWHRLLHSQLAPRLRLALRSQPNLAITTVPFHLPA